MVSMINAVLEQVLFPFHYTEMMILINIQDRDPMTH